jgi:Domain of unknown function (DUF1707)
VSSVDSSDDRQQESGLARRDSGPHLRVSDGERDLVATELGEHFQAGRLDSGEFDERLTLALGARTRGDLAGLLADLPAPPPAPAPVPAVPSGPPGPGLRVLPMLLPMLFVLIIASGFAHGGPHDGGSPWPLLWLWWLIPIAIFRIRRGGPRRDGGPQD